MEKLRKEDRQNQTFSKERSFQIKIFAFMNDFYLKVDCA